MKHNLVALQKEEFNYSMYEGFARTSHVFNEIINKMYSSHKIENAFSALGKAVGDDYKVSDQAFEALNDIYCKLTCEDQTLRTFRRALGLGQYVQNDLIPFLIHVKDAELIDMMIRILVNLTMPVECLFSTKVMMRTEIGRHTVSDLTALLMSCKECFTDARATRAVVDFMKNVFDKGNKLSKFAQCDSINNCLLLLRNILHIPEMNVVAMSSSERYRTNAVSMQNKIIWHLFMMSIDKLLLFLMSCSQRDFWSVTMVQLISVMYKDQQASTLQKLLNVWLEDALSDSSDDFESNTTPLQKENSGESLTSDPTTSDSSDNGGGNEKNIEKSMEIRRSQANVKSVEAAINLKSQQSAKQCENTDESTTLTSTEDDAHSDRVKSTDNPTEKANRFDASGTFESPSVACKKIETIVENGVKRTQYPSTPDQSDCGYGTHPESTSITSSEDHSNQNYHQRPQRIHVVKKPCKASSTQELKDRRRKKLVKRSKSSLINMKGLVHHTPTDEDISNILKEFTVDFLLKGYSHLMQELYSKLLSDTDLQSQIDTSHFFWLVTYFLKFAAQLELDLEHIKCVLSYKIVSYLTYEAVFLYEQLELTSRQYEIDLEPSLRRMHLVVTAIREFLQALNTYTNIGHLSTSDIEYIRLLQVQISITVDLKQLFILLIRNYKPSIQSKQYLQDLIVTNHMLLIISDSVDETSNQSTKTQLKEHIQQFATVEMMQQYGILLENFLENGEFVNDCILTMMYHVGGELGKVTSLFQPVILKTYSKIWETEYELCDDWSDLIFYVMTKFISTPQKPPINLTTPSLIAGNHIEQLDEKRLCRNAWSKEEMDVLYWYYEESKSYPDVIGQMVKRFRDSNFKTKYRIDVILQLLQQDIINRPEFNTLMKYENVEFERNFQSKQTVRSADEPSTSANSSNSAQSRTEKSHDNIQILKERLLRENQGKHIAWLQKILMEYCFAKLCAIKNEIVAKDPHNVTVIEPVPYHCILKKHAVPVVPWNAEQSNILSYEPFILLLHQLGFHLYPADAGKLFVRVPEFWTADILFSMAKKLGPIDESTLKFDISELNVRPAQFTMHASINHEQKITDTKNEVIMKNGALNIAFPTNVLNTSSILNRQIHTNRLNASSTGFTCPESAIFQYNPDMCLHFSSSVSISIASNEISIVQSSKVSVKSDRNKLSDSNLQMDIDKDSSSVSTAFEVNDENDETATMNFQDQNIVQSSKPLLSQKSPVNEIKNTLN